MNIYEKIALITFAFGILIETLELIGILNIRITITSICFYIMLVLIMLVDHYNKRRNSGEFYNPPEQVQESYIIDEYIDYSKIESWKINDLNPDKIDGQMCCICLENFNENQDISYIGECTFHLYHTSCKVDYLRHKYTHCPVCNK